jgi:hypothetical protein
VTGAPFDPYQIQLSPTCPLTLNETQRQALGALAVHRRLFGPIGVGHGKSWIAVLAGAALNAELAVILAPAATLPNLRREYARLRQHFRIPRTIIESYERLSRPAESCYLTDLIGPARRVVLVADEAHRLKARDSARTLRVARFLERHADRVAFVALSGTLTTRSVNDFAHLARWALRGASPLPTRQQELDQWSQCLDVKGRPSWADWQGISPLFAAAGLDVHATAGAARVETARRLFRELLDATPGVVATDEQSLGVSLELIAVEDGEVETPDVIQQALDRIEQEGADPSGEILVDELAEARVARQVAQGFYYRWRWPNGEPDHEWVAARSAWFRYVREQIKDDAREGHDSPLLVYRATLARAQAGARDRGVATLAEWQRHQHKPPPPVEAVWISPYLLQHAVAWMRAQREPVILWIEHQAVADLLRRFDACPVFGQGDTLPERPVSCAASIRVFGTGANLQRWRSQLIVSPPSSGAAWEQLLGRCHRQGQTADSVEARVYAHVPVYEKAIAAALADAAYIEAVSGNRQKLRYATKTGGVFDE